MKVVIDLDSHQAIQDFGNRSAAGTYQFKSQDTVEWELYFAQGGIVKDMGASFALKFGMIKTGDATNTLLAYQTTFTYSTDAQGNVYYSGLVNFNTAQMATAMGTAPSIQGTAEVRYQDSLSEIIHSINISTQVFATILVETGVTPPGVSTGYPDASTIELLVHKNAPSGYAGLNASSQVNGSVVPLDVQTIKLNSSGQVSSAAILTYTNANFVTPAPEATVSVILDSSSGFVLGQYVRIPIAGYYVVKAIAGDGVTVTLQNNGDPFNALAGVTINSGTVILPAQAAAGGAGGGQAAYTTLQAGFTQPAAGATVSINVASTAWMPGPGYAIFIGGAGYYLISSITNANNVVVTNAGSAANQPPGSTIPMGATVSPAGPQGAQGPAGVSLSAYTATTAPFTMPAVAASVSITVGNTAWVSQNQIIFVSGAGYLQVANVVNATILSCNNLNYPGNATAGTTIAAGANVTPAGLMGPQGAGGAGLNAFTTLAANFTQPPVGSSVAINVGTTAWMAVGQGIFVQGGGYYTVTSISDLTHAVVTNLGGASNPAQGSIITGGGTPAPSVAPAGIPGTTGVNAFTTLTANFVTPAAGASATITVANTTWASNGQNIFIAGAGYYQIASILSGTQLSVTNLGANYGNTAGGTTINSGASVSSAGVIGPAGPAGGQGAPGRDGAYATIYTGDSIQGTGGVTSPAILVGDIAQASGAYKVYQRDASGNSKWDVALLSAADAVGAPTGSEVSNIQSLASGVLSLKKLKTGPAGSVVLTDNGGTSGDILVDVPVDGTTITVVGGKLTASGGGGGGAWNPASGVFFQDDFTGGFSSTSPPYNSCGNSVAPVPVVYGNDATRKAVGVVKVTNGVGSSPVGEALFYGNYNNVPSPGIFYIGVGAIIFKTRVAFAAAAGGLPVSGNTVAMRAGLIGCASGNFNVNFPNLTGATNIIMFEYSPDQNGGNFRVATGTTTPIYVNTSQAVAADTFYDLEFDVNAAGTSITFYINTVLVATVNTNLPTLYGVMWPCWIANRGGSTSVDNWHYVDYWSIQQSNAR